MPAEGGDRPATAPRLRGIGHAVERDDERLLARVRAACDQVGWVGVGVSLDPQRQALVDRAAGDPVQLRPARLDDRDPGVSGQHYGLPDPLVVVEPRPDVQRGRRDTGAQRLQHRVAPGYQLGPWRPRPVPGRPAATTSAAGDRRPGAGATALRGTRPARRPRLGAAFFACARRGAAPDDRAHRRPAASGPLPSSLRLPYPPVPGRGLPDLVRPPPLLARARS